MKSPPISASFNWFYLILLCFSIWRFSILVDSTNLQICWPTFTFASLTFIKMNHVNVKVCTINANNIFSLRDVIGISFKAKLHYHHFHREIGIHQNYSMRMKTIRLEMVEWVILFNGIISVDQSCLMMIYASSWISECFFNLFHLTFVYKLNL